AARELQARVAHLLGPDAPVLPIIQPPKDDTGFGGAISIDYITMGDMLVLGDLPRMVPEQTYYVRPGNNNRVRCWGESPAATYFAVQSLMQLTYERDGAAYLQKADIVDGPMFAVRSFKMGGRNWDLVREMGRWCGHYKYNCYNVCYTTLGRDQWKNPSAEYRGLLADLCAYRIPRGLDVMPFVNPYYLWEEHIVISDDAQIDALAATCSIALEHGARKVMLCLDDFASRKIPYTIYSEADRKSFKTLGEANAHLITQLHKRLKARFPDCELFVVPPYYWIPKGSYKDDGEADLRTIGAGTPKDVHIVWTGPVVRSAVIREEDVGAYTQLIGRKPFLWDNTLYMHHKPPSYFFDAFVTRYPDRFWELNDTGVHYNAGGGEVYKVGLMTTADYLWNPQAYDPEESLRRALHQATGSPEAAEACLALRDAYYGIYDTYKPVLDSLLELKKEADFRYRPFDSADLDAIERDLRAVTEAYARVKRTCRNAALSDELGEYAQRCEQYGEMVAWLREHQAPPPAEQEEVAVNGGAEDVDDAGRPIGWGKYQGAGAATIGTSERDPAEGRRCAYLEVGQWYDLQGRDWINVALVLGDSNGYAGPNAYVARPLTKYRVRFKLRGDAAKVRFAPVGWRTDAATAGDRQNLFCTLSQIRPTAEWREYEASFTTALDTKRFAIKFALEGYRDEGARLGRIYVDDVQIFVGA
ncbi:MAG: beta-N-acetylglucosaminidase domain-containing protein, partial [Armatimonadota bacterium]